MNTKKLHEKRGQCYYYVSPHNYLIKTDYYGSFVLKSKANNELLDETKIKEAQEEFNYLFKCLGTSVEKEKQSILPEFDYSATLIEGIRIIPTLECNLACLYCPQKHVSKVRMDEKIASKVIDFIINQVRIDKKIHIKFYGGEPFLNFSTIEQITENLHTSLSEKHVLHFSATTNGVLLNDKIINFLRKYNFNLGISLDGPACIHNKNRIFRNGNGSFNKVFKNIIRIREIADDYFHNKVTILATIDPKEFKDYKIAMNFLIAEGFPNISLNWLKKKNYTLISRDILRDITLNIVNQNYKDVPFVNFMKQIDSLRCGSRSLDKISCGAGRKILAISPLGEIYPCEQFIDKSIGKIGDVVNGVNKHLIEIMYASLNKGIRDCIKCWAMRFCPYYCIFRQPWLKSKRCIFFKKQTTDILRMCIDFAEKEPSTYLKFLSFLYNKPSLFEKDEY